MHWLKKRPGPSIKGTGLNSVLHRGGPTYQHHIEALIEKIIIELSQLVIAMKFLRLLIGEVAFQHQK